MKQVLVEQKITKDMTIGDLVKRYPSVTEILLAEGVHCVGCGASYFETIEQGLMGHGHTPEQVEDAVRRLNEAIPRETGNLDTLRITENAAKKLKEILKSRKKENYSLRIKVMPGGCSGYQYAFELDTKENKDDQVIKMEGVKFVVDPDSFSLIRGSRVDYIDSLQGAGFKISNPNAVKTCGCGQSFH